MIREMVTFCSLCVLLSASSFAMLVTNKTEDETYTLCANVHTGGSAIDSPAGTCESEEFEILPGESKELMLNSVLRDKIRDSLKFEEKPTLYLIGYSKIKGDHTSSKSHKIEIATFDQGYSQEKFDAFDVKLFKFNQGGPDSNYQYIVEAL